MATKRKTPTRKTPPTATDEPACAASLRAKTLDVAATAIAQTAEATLRADAKAAETASRLFERLTRTANSLNAADGKTQPQDADDALDLEAERDALLLRIDEALEGGRTARRLEVEALIARGVDPREAWFWDAGDGDWIWNPGAVLAEAARETALRLETRTLAYEAPDPFTDHPGSAKDEPS